MEPKHIIVVGGSVSGLGVATALAQDGHRVTVLEGDHTPMPADPMEAFERWDRRGSPQTRHSHAFLARLHNTIRDDVPELLDKLRDAGAESMTFRSLVPPAMTEPEFLPGDDDINMLACRRITFEWVLRRFILDGGRVEFRDGVKVEGLTYTENADGPPRVTGVKLSAPNGAATLEADVVVDATGRRSKVANWLREIGARELKEDSESCGVFYTSRFYRLLGEAPPLLREGGMGGDLGYVKYGVFRGDSGIFSITLAACPDDDPLRAVLHREPFEAATAALPATRDWVHPDMAEPLTDVHGMANLRNTRRFPVAGGEPLALNLHMVGDSLIHTNPMYGRGCTLGWVGAWELRDALRAHPDDPRACALTYAESVEREIVPWYQSSLTQDREALEINQMQRDGIDPNETQRDDGTVDPKAYMRSVFREGLLPALRKDLVVLRAFMRTLNLLEDPADLLKDPELMQRVLKYFGEREGRAPLVQGPSRTEMLEILAPVSS